ncbi:hypothetical protein [Bacillus manliponensis]|uniref:hypothetical protein n=1 Tax=Bacillus manliponensis TaxID=574376 RepID=UPI003512C2E8
MKKIIAMLFMSAVITLGGLGSFSTAQAAVEENKVINFIQPQTLTSSSDSVVVNGCRSGGIHHCKRYEL